MALVERGGLHCEAPDWKEFSKMLIIFNHQPIIEMHPVSQRGPLELQVSMVSLPLYVGGSGGSSPGPFQPFKFFPPPPPQPPPRLCSVSHPFPNFILSLLIGSSPLPINLPKPPALRGLPI